MLKIEFVTVHHDFDGSDYKPCYMVSMIYVASTAKQNIADHPHHRKQQWQP
jgi:hypothetical protein